MVGKIFYGFQIDGSQANAGANDGVKRMNSVSQLHQTSGQAGRCFSTLQPAAPAPAEGSQSPRALV
jgi:hypothetical protein